MIINISPEAYSHIKQNAAAKNLTPQKHVETLINDMHEDSSCYIILKPIPHDLKIRAINATMKTIIDDFEVVMKDGAEILVPKLKEAEESLIVKP